MSWGGRAIKNSGRGYGTSASSDDGGNDVRVVVKGGDLSPRRTPLGLLQHLVSGVVSSVISLGLTLLLGFFGIKLYGDFVCAGHAECSVGGVLTEGINYLIPEETIHRIATTTADEIYDRQRETSRLNQAPTKSCYDGSSVPITALCPDETGPKTLVVKAPAIDVPSSLAVFKGSTVSARHARWADCDSDHGYQFTFSPDGRLSVNSREVDLSFFDLDLYHPGLRRLNGCPDAILSTVMQPGPKGMVQNALISNNGAPYAYFFSSGPHDLQAMAAHVGFLRDVNGSPVPAKLSVAIKSVVGSPAANKLGDFKIAKRVTLFQNCKKTDGPPTETEIVDATDSFVIAIELNGSSDAIYFPELDTVFSTRTEIPWTGGSLPNNAYRVVSTAGTYLVEFDRFLRPVRIGKAAGPVTGQ